MLKERIRGLLARIRPRKRLVTGSYTTPQGHPVYCYDDGGTRYQP